MVQNRQVQAQLKQLGINIRSWGAAEAQELPNILVPGENIKALLHGWYENGFATLVATDMRLLLVDKKLFHLTIEDIRYDMIAEVDYNARLLDATVSINTLNKQLKFTSLRQKQLRSLTTYVQQRVMELRQHQFTASQFDKINPPESPTNSSWLTKPLATATSSVPDMPLPTSTDNKFAVVNPYARQSLTTKHKFLPKIPHRRLGL